MRPRQNQTIVNQNPSTLGSLRCYKSNNYDTSSTTSTVLSQNLMQTKESKKSDSLLKETTELQTSHTFPNIIAKRALVDILNRTTSPSKRMRHTDVLMQGYDANKKVDDYTKQEAIFKKASDLTMSAIEANTKLVTTKRNSTDMASKNPETIDEALYNRQLYVMGHAAQRRMRTSKVLIIGLKGLGVEIAKNIIIMGVGEVHLLDQEKVEIGDLSANFYLEEDDIGKPRAHACLSNLSELNNYVKVCVIQQSLDEKLLLKNNYHMVVMTESLLTQKIKINDFCHDHGIKFISGDIRGLLFSIFVDFGEEHIIIDTNGENPQRGLISNITRGNPGVVTMYNMGRHGLSDGDYVTFEEVEGMIELNNTKPFRIKVINSYSFSINNTTDFNEYTGTKGYFNQSKMPQAISFQKLKDVISKPKIIADFLDTSIALHCLYQALLKFQEIHAGKLPRPDSKADSKEVIDLAKCIAANKGFDKNVNLCEEKYLQLARCSSAILNPMAAYGGGIIAQEIVKGCTGKFTPIIQQYYFAASEVLPLYIKDWSEFSPQNSRYDSQIAVLGKSLHKKLQQQSFFLVGAGAIGCEMLKNWAMMGVATTNSSKIHVTDMDTIEKSNLSRQFLFREKDIKQLKSSVASKAANGMNPSMNIDAKSVKVGPSTEAVYNDAFWDSVDCVCTALDNIETRLYIDQRCILFQKPLIDSGTLGTKGNTQVIIPHLTESYASSRDPPEESIPICTLKNFPNKIEHTIQWARDIFEGYFKQGPHEVNQYLSEENYIDELRKQPNRLLPNLKIIQNYLVLDKPSSFDECIIWARKRFEIEFNNNIQQLLFAFPPDSKTSEGIPFWSGLKRTPTPLDFDINDPLHLDFVMATANLLAYNYGFKNKINRDYFKEILNRVILPTFSPSSTMKIAANDEEQQKIDDTANQIDDYDQVQNIISKLPEPSSLSSFRLYNIEFEKDDPTNFHIDFVTACSNCRARNYAIKEKSKYETKLIAGKIIPAIATTTAAVTGLVCLELYKKIQPEKSLEDYKNTYINLAIPLFTMSCPLSMGYTTSMIKGKEFKWSLWDHIEVDIGDVTMQSFLKWFQDKYGLVINMLSQGERMLYFNFMGHTKAVKARLAMPMSKVVESLSKQQIPSHEIYLILEACCNHEDDEDDDVEIPHIKFKFRSSM